MFNKKKLLFILGIACVLLATLFACTINPRVEHIEIEEGSYKTTYIINEELDVDNMKIKVSYNNDTKTVYSVSEIRKDLVFSNFDNTKENNNLTIKVTYLGKATAYFNVEIISLVDSQTKYSVKFDSKGGTEIADLEIPAFTTIPSDIIQPIRDGYFFMGWYIEESLTNQWDFHTSKVDSNITLYAKWGKLLTVKFIGDAVVVRSDVREGETYENIPPVPYREGQNGVWSLDGNTPYSGEWNDLVDGLTFFALYTPKQYQVSFFFRNTQNAEEIYELGAFNHGSNVNELASDLLDDMHIPIRPNYKITGWRIEGEGISAIESSYTGYLNNILSDLRIEAVYELVKHTVTFDFGDGADIMERYATAEIYHDTTIKPEHKPTVPYRANHQFDGWYHDIGYSTRWNDNSDIVTTDTMLFAKWTILHTIVFTGYGTDGDNGGDTISIKVRDGEMLIPPLVKDLIGYNGVWNRDFLSPITDSDTVEPIYTKKMLTVVFKNYDNETILVNGFESQVIEYGTDATPPDITPQREHYRFVKWSLSYENVTADLVIIAEFEQVYYDVEFFTGIQGIERPSLRVASGGKIVALSDLEESGKDFDGWYKDASFNHKWDISLDTVTEDITLFAKWTTLHVLTFNYKDDDGNIISTVIRQVRDGETLKDVPNVQLVEGMIGRWKLDGVDINFDGWIIQNSINDIVATYEPATYTVYFLNSVGDVIYTIANINHGETVEPPAELPTKQGHTFNRWNYDPYNTPIVKDTTFDPIFDVNTFKVRFLDSHDPDNIVELRVYDGATRIKYDTPATPPDNPEYYIDKGYRFTGWDKQYTNITEDLDIYAKFEKIRYQVTFRDDNSNIIKVYEIEHGDTVIYDQENPTKIGHTFVGWNYDLTKTITENTWITAVFIRNLYTVNLHASGGELAGGIDQLTAEYNRKLIEPINPTYTGKAFIGWYTDTNYINRYDFSQPVVDNFNLYAKWEDYIDGSDGVEYLLEGSTYTVVSAPQNANTITITNFIDGKEVTTIGNGVFENMTSLKTVYLPNTLTTIGPRAFYGCNQLEYIDIPDLVKTIGENAFYNCTNLVSINFGAESQLSHIGKFAFSNAYSLLALHLPLGLKEIGERAFYNNKSLTTLEIPSSVTLIAKEAFASAENLKYAIFKGLTPLRMENDVFKNRAASFRIYVDNLSAYTNPNTGGGWIEIRDNNLIYPLSQIADGWAYDEIKTGENSGKIKLIQYVGEDSQVIIGSSIAINGQQKLIAEIGAYALDNLIVYLEINSDFIIDQNALKAATSLQHLSVNVKDSFLIDKNILNNVFQQTESLNQLSLSAKLTLREFFGGTPPAALKVVNIKDDTDSIPNRMFYNCENIVKVVLADTIISIGAEAFSGCTMLNTVVIPDSVVEIGEKAFYNSANLPAYNEQSGMGLSVPQTVSKIGHEAFSKTAYLAGFSSDFVIIGNGILYTYQGSDAIVILPQAVKVINSYAFYNKINIRTVVYDVTRNAELLEIGEHAFDGCNNIEHVILMFKAGSSPVIGRYAFANTAQSTSKLSKVVIFSEIAPTLGENAFHNAMNGMEVYVNSNDYATSSDWQDFNIIRPNELRVYNDWVFTNAVGGIKLVQYFGSNNNIELQRTFNDGMNDRDIISIGNYAFVRNLTHLTISASVLVDTNAFGGVTNLKELTLLNSQSENMNRALLYSTLNNNKKLDTLNVGGSVALRTIFDNKALPAHLTRVNVLEGEKSIVSAMFKDCQYITEINFPSTLEISQVGAYAFDGSGWEREYDGDFVVLDDIKLLVSYKGQDNIIDIPQDIIAINRSVFKDNKDIEIIRIASGIRHIYESAFDGMQMLVKIFIDCGDAPTIGMSALSGLAEGFELFVPESGVSSYTVEKGWIGISVVADKTVTTADYIYEEIDAGTAGHGIKLIQYIGEQAIVSLPDTIDELTIKELGNNVFLKGVNQLDFDGSIKINEYTYKNLYNLVKISLNNVDSISPARASILYNILDTNNYLSRLSYDASVPLYQVLDGRVPPETLTEIEIIDGSTAIVDNMLQYCSDIQTIIIPNTVQQVGTYAFEDTLWFSRQGNFVTILDGLLYKYKGMDASIIIPADVRIVNEKAFASFTTGVWVGNARVQSIKFAVGSRAQEIKDQAFYGCSSLFSLDIPDTLHTIAPSAFIGTKIVANSNGMLIAEGGATSTLIKYNGNLSEVEIPTTIRYINKDAFKGNTSITKVTFRAGSLISHIRAGAFADCTSLTTVDIPNSVMEIGKDAFLNTPWFDNGNEYIVTAPTLGIKRLVLYKGSQTAITIGAPGTPTAGLTDMSANAFSSITQGTLEITFVSELPVRIERGALDKASIIKVPAAVVENYQSAWQQYRDIIIAID